MNTLFINGSPKGKKGNTALFIREITSGITEHYDTRILAHEKTDRLAGQMLAYDAVIIVMPLYIHAMPAKVKELFEQMAELDFAGKKLGFIVQFGFEESATADYLMQYLEVFTERLQCDYLGTILKPGAAGAAILPECFSGKLFKRLRLLGQEYNQNHSFSPETQKDMGAPYELSEKQVRMYSSPMATRINKIVWHHILRKNKAFDKKYDMPYKIS